jgi:hypothetical protein
MSKQREVAEKIVRQYAKGLSTFDLDLIAPILHAGFKFVYRIGGNGVRIIAHPSRLREAMSRNRDMGYGIKTDIRYIGHLYKVFLELKKQGVSKINTDFFYSEIDNEQILCIKLIPPHYRGIVYPMDYQLREDVRRNLPVGDAFILPRIKHGMLCKIECYDSMEAFNDHVDGTFYRGVDKEWIKT